MADEFTSITLTLYQDGQLVNEEQFDRAVINVGKQASSNLRLDDVNISRKHAVIERRQEGRWRITDLGSTNGTSVNGRQITQANLRDGDRISLGNSTIVVHLGRGQGAHGSGSSSDETLETGPVQEIPGLGENSFYHVGSEEEEAREEMVMEVALLWGQSVLTVQHYDTPETVEIGEIPGCRFFLPEEALGIPKFTLIESVNGLFGLNLAYDGFQGDVLIDGTIIPIADLKGSGKLQGDHLLVTGPVRARIRLGEFVILISYGPMPQRPKISPIGAVDLTPHIYTAISAVVHIAFLLFLSLVPEAQLRSKLDPDARRARLISVLKVTKPEEEEKQDPEEEQRRLEEEKKKKERLKVQDTEIKQPAREPKLLDKLSKKQKKELDALSQLSDEERKRKLREIAATAGAAKLLNEDQGLLSALLDTSNTDAFQEKFRALGSTGGDESASAAAGSIDPFGGTLGAGGANGGFAGSSSIGSGGSGPGSGGLIDGLDKGANRRDLDDIKLRERPMTPVAIASSAKVSGRLDRKTVQKIIRRNLSGIKWCYQDALQRNPKLRGKVTLSFTILPNGRLQTPKAHNPSIHDNKLLDCITGKMKRWRFPAPKDGGVVKVTYPLILKTR